MVSKATEGAVLTALLRMRDGGTATAICEATGLSRTTVNRTLTELHCERFVLLQNGLGLRRWVALDPARKHEATMDELQGTEEIMIALQKVDPEARVRTLKWIAKTMNISL